MSVLRYHLLLTGWVALFLLLSVSFIPVFHALVFFPVCLPITLLQDRIRSRKLEPCLLEKTVYLVREELSSGTTLSTSTNSTLM